MQSENFVFLSLFISLLLALWGNTSVASKKDFQFASNSPQVEFPRGKEFGFNKSYFQANFSFFSSALLVFLANFVLSLFLLRRWVDSGYPPFSNLYESLLFLTWSLLFLYFPAIDFTKDIKILFYLSSPLKNKLPNLNTEIEKDEETQNFQTPSFQTFGHKLSKKLSSLIGMLLVSSSLFIYTFATWVLPSSMKEIKPLIPALKSNWLLMHVSIMLLSYSALLAGSLFSILYLVIFYLKVKKEKPKDVINPSSLGQTGTLSILENLDLLSYRSLGFAFPLLTLGIISGSVWANEAWGSYWSWDPKETWALITWFIYSIYLHLRIQKAWASEKAALVGSLGFFVVWICYLGVNLLGKGLHSYGWWN